MDTSDAVEAKIHDKIAWLERVFDRLIGCQVVVEAPHKRSRHGNLYRVTIELSVPGGPPIFIGREHHDKQQHEDVYVAVRDAFDSARRVLQEYARKLRDEVKIHEVPPHGRIVSMPGDDYGFIETSEGVEVYFHANAVVDGSFAELKVGDEVRFDLHEGEGEKGPQASTVRPIGKHHLPDIERTPS